MFGQGLSEKRSEIYCLKYLKFKLTYFVHRILHHQNSEVCYLPRHPISSLSQIRFFHDQNLILF